jgi:uncharacterized protein (TIGR03437 family)
VVNAASQQGGPIAPGEILTIYGTNLGPPTPQSAGSINGAFASSLGGVEVLFGQFAGTPLLAYQGQINVVVPFELPPGATIEAEVLNYGVPSPKFALPVVAAAPALFTRDGSGGGPVAVVNQDGSVNTPSPPGSVVTLYGTGGGTFAGVVDGGTARRPASLSGTVRVTIASRDAQVLYAGTAPGLTTGAFQLNVQLPVDLPSGAVSIGVNIQGADSAKGTTLAIR